MRQEVNTLSKGRGLPQQLMEQLCLHPNKGASPQPQTGVYSLPHAVCRFFFVAEGRWWMLILPLLALIQPTVWRPQLAAHL